MRVVGVRGRSTVFDFAALRRDIRASLLDASFALALTMVLFAWLYRRIDDGSSATIEVMPFLAGGADEYWMYWLCEAFGWSALLWAWGTVILGLLRSSSITLPLSAATVERLHRTTSLTTIGLMFAHAFWFFAEEIRANEKDLGWLGRTVHAFGNVFVPGVYPSGTGKIAILIGLLALYLAIPFGLAYYSRRALGARAWRTLHAAILVVYLLSVWHTLLYTTNAWFDGPLRTTIWLLQLPIAGMLLIRLLAPAHRPHATALDRIGSWLARVAAAGAVVVVIGATASGIDGGRTRGVEGTGPNVSQPMIWTGLAVFAAVVTAAVLRARRTLSKNMP